MKKEEKIVKGFKGFDENLKCRNFQYEVGKEYTMDDSPLVCKKGFHFCEYPLDVFRYYPPVVDGKLSRYATVDGLGKISKKENDDDTKVATDDLKINAEISIAGLIKASIDYTTSRAKKIKGNVVNKDYGASSSTGYRGASSSTGNCGASSSTGYRGASSSTGDYGASSSTGNCGASSSTGNCGASSSTGNCGASSSTGYCGASSSTGNYGASSSTGNYGASSSTGYCGASSSTGYCGASSSTGDCGASVVTGYNGQSISGNNTAVAVAWGYESKAKGILGSYLVCAEWAQDKKSYEWSFKGAKMVKVDGKKIKENTFYQLINGKFVEATKC